MQKTPAKRFDIIFDQYFTPSIKDYERIQRGNVSSIDYKITGPEQTRPKDFNKELRNSKFKDALVRFLIEHWGAVEMVPFIGNSTIKLNYDVCYTFTSDGASVSKIVDEEMSCELQEEADTKIVYHVCKAVCENVLIKCSDTDILIIMLGNMDHLSHDELHIFMELGTGNNKRCIDINDLSEQLGPSLCQSLPGFHALTGCDYSPAFYRKGKKRPFQILKKSPEYQNAFIELGNINSIATKTHIFKMLEKFVCEMYNLRNINDVNSGRFSKFWETYKASNVNEVFQKQLKNFDASSLPPCKTELHQQLLRAQYIGNTWRNAYLKSPTCYIPESNGWVRNGQFLSFNWFDGDQFPQSVLGAVIETPSTNDNIESDAEAEEIENDYFSSDSESISDIEN
ncbi:uncharacterized protein LOC128860783 [Anastrepha ludens]|uniref:uncharacterized protein LOC128860783 n=1 Tax=Anastrepha ludens TaxID=28586 RepID=UPI0023AE8D32|nr:uncharacterized protein LOC128860783 [Anastrepha ludens]